jgi:hypothetical protein
VVQPRDVEVRLLEIVEHPVLDALDGGVQVRVTGEDQDFGVGVDRLDPVA